MKTGFKAGRLTAVLGVAAAVLVGLPIAAGATTAAGPPATASGTTADGPAVVPIQVTGPATSRFNLVVMGDGYTAAELPKFRAQVDKHLNVLWSIEPFKSYRNYLNVYAVEIPSPESGVDCDPDLTSPKVDTPLQMGFWGGCNPNSVQRLLTVSSTAAAQYADLVPGTTSANRQILAIGNSDTYGGAGGTYATASGGNALSALITPHELGHSLGGLEDEYDYYARGDRGAPYAGPEPTSIHHTLLTEQQLLDQQLKWWRWLGEESESGGRIGRYEGGMYAGSAIWRPSRHSMMKTLGYYFDQISRERMTQRISSRASLFQGSTPVGQVAGDQVVWLQTLHPADHELDVTWTLDGEPLPAGNARAIDLGKLTLTPGTHILTAKIVDPTEFVRDPAVRASAALTATRSWTIDSTLTARASDQPATFTTSTATDQPVNADEVVYVETTQSDSAQPAVSWQLDGRPAVNPGNDRDFDLEPLRLTGRHTLTATVDGDTRSWAVDGVEPVVGSTLSKPLLTVTKPSGPEYIFNDAFTMKLTATDDTDGYVVPEFRVNGDGWYNYYGWPTDADAPFRFTAEGTEIDQLVYGKLGVPRVVPWDDVPSGYGRHTVEYRAIDAPGNIGTPGRFAVTLLRPAPTCTTTITGVLDGPLVVRSGVTCLQGATVRGPVTVSAGASLVATDSRIVGPVSGSRAAQVHLLRSTVNGPVSIDGITGAAVLVGSTVTGPVSVVGARTAEPVVLAGNTIGGPLACSANSATPTNLQAPNQVSGPRSGQCAKL
ncbi:IgA peptidase M64 [Kribbella sp. VKM Ac-2527]|uniref:IgA peptidase M64 n=1 Tax=Kribbella caucasensis TaxID=2512215 RepID=A0A4R6KBM8_9ACTN|nr:M64 family metallopeptidase [Kribbella sp. VKM Ac-2527]TDO47376.1 IgA peptidase M64 [Kribbella sp. VKM Ac-2527]